MMVHQVTLNVCLGDVFDGAGLTFCGDVGSSRHRFRSSVKAPLLLRLPLACRFDASHEASLREMTPLALLAVQTEKLLSTAWPLWGLQHCIHFCMCRHGWW